MPAPFAADLCGYRADKNKPGVMNPNTSDSSKEDSRELGKALFAVLGVPDDQQGVRDPGKSLEDAIVNHLQPLRPDLAIERSRSALEFEQYAHLKVYPDFRDGHLPAVPHIDRLREIAETLPPSAARGSLKRRLAATSKALEKQDRISQRLKSSMPEESFLNLDITCASEEEDMEPVLHIALSSKWSLRTDRAQDCVSQGSKLAAQRRGPMPHFAVITMEPRPSMLKILADGSGAVDYVYHLNLPALIQAVETVRSKPDKKSTWSPGLTFDRLLHQRRLRDYDDLVKAVLGIRAVRPSVPEGAALKATEAL